LELIKKNNYAVIVSDMNMPKMDGIEFFKNVMEVAPKSVRIMLTGNANNKTAIDAINNGHIFRFLTKPCPPQILLKAILEGIQQFQLVNTEKELLENTLKGSISVMSDLISMSNPFLYSIVKEIIELNNFILEKNSIEPRWEDKVAANFSLLGLLSVDIEKLSKLIEELSFNDDKPFYVDYFSLGGEILTSIPRLDFVVLILTSLRYSKSDLAFLREDIRIPTAALRLAIDYVFYSTKGFFQGEIIEKFLKSDRYYKDFVTCLEHLDRNISVENLAELEITKIKEGMIIQRDVMSEKGLLLIPKDTVVNPTIIKLLKAFAKKEANITEVLVKY